MPASRLTGIKASLLASHTAVSVQAELEKWAKVVKAAGIRAD
jgi:hypothetical protein